MTFVADETLALDMPAAKTRFREATTPAKALVTAKAAPAAEPGSVPPPALPEDWGEFVSSWRADEMTRAKETAAETREQAAQMVRDADLHCGELVSQIHKERIDLRPTNPTFNRGAAGRLLARSYPQWRAAKEAAARNKAGTEKAGT